MILVSNIDAPIGYKENEVLAILAEELAVSVIDIEKFKLVKRSIDARRKSSLRYTMSYYVWLAKGASTIEKNNVKIVVESELHYNTIIYKQLKPTKVVVVGAGPAGLFATLILARAGLCPHLIERGDEIDKRVKAVEGFLSSGILDTESNVQFGEGGAGTFSDGKLTTGIKDTRMRFVLDEFIKAGAPEDIEYEAHPHIGTDKLRGIVKNMRNEIIALGGKVSFNTRLININKLDNKISSINYINGGVEQEEECEELVLAIGHSARDTYKMLYDKGVIMEPKAFSIGVRIEHHQKLINKSQYGREDITADYKLSTRLKDGRGIYTFCMCPGGKVISSASEAGGVVVNGMSNYAREGINSNSAILASVTPSDFASQDALAGIEFQRKYERLAYNISHSYNAPCQLVGDFMAGRASKKLGSVAPTYSPQVVLADLKYCLPTFAYEGIKFGIKEFNNKLQGFGSQDAVLTGVETRSSAPLRIVRNETYEAQGIKGLFPVGEGAGYAGGIMSAAVDGVRVAETILSNINSELL